MKILRFLLCVFCTFEAFQLAQGAAQKTPAQRMLEIKRLENLDSALLEAIETQNLEEVKRLLNEGALASTSLGDAVDVAKALDLSRAFLINLDYEVRKARLRPLQAKRKSSTVMGNTGQKKRRRRTHLASKNPQESRKTTKRSGSNSARKLTSKSSREAQAASPLRRAHATRNSSSATKSFSTYSEKSLAYQRGAKQRQRDSLLATVSLQDFLKKLFKERQLLRQGKSPRPSRI